MFYIIHVLCLTPLAESLQSSYMFRRTIRYSCEAHSCMCISARNASVQNTVRLLGVPSVPLNALRSVSKHFSIGRWSELTRATPERYNLTHPQPIYTRGSWLPPYRGCSFLQAFFLPQCLDQCPCQLTNLPTNRNLDDRVQQRYPARLRL